MHCIAAHHGKLEYGAIVKPAIREAEVLSLIDMFDNRMNEFMDKIYVERSGSK